jgi:16S rRNA (guanine527-N7)-methyltransferase
MCEDSPSQQLNSLLAESGLDPLAAEVAGRFEQYLRLLLHWNTRLNLTAIRTPDAILSRHFLESIACARALPAGISTLLDFGSGAGFPGIPIALCRPEIAVTLAESQGKKAAFLREAIRMLGISAKVHAARAELLTAQFECITLRAVDRMESAIEGAKEMLAPNGWLALMTTQGDLEQYSRGADAGFSRFTVYPLPRSEGRILALGQRNVSSPA